MTQSAEAVSRRPFLGVSRLAAFLFFEDEADHECGHYVYGVVRLAQ